MLNPTYYSLYLIVVFSIFIITSLYSLNRCIKRSKKYMEKTDESKTEESPVTSPKKDKIITSNIDNDYYENSYPTRELNIS